MAVPAPSSKALDLDAAYIDAVEKVYNPAEPRVPAGSGRPSGEWTRGLSVLGDLTAEAAEQLGNFALRLLGASLSEGAAAVAAFGLLFIPSPNRLSVEGEVDGLPGVSYAWNRDESTLHLTYESPEGIQNTFSAQLEDDVFRDKSGRIIAHILPGGSIAVDPAAVFPDVANDNEPRLCPLPGLDKPGERGRDYEDYVKSVVNSVDTTPRYWGFQLLNPGTGKLVYYDDCQHTTGMMVDAKGPEYANLLTFDAGRKSVQEQFLDESARQLAALGTRRLRWYFAEPAAADFARELFRAAGGGRDRIEIIDLPWP